MLIARSCTSVWGGDVVREIRRVNLMGVRIACRGTRNRRDRREAVEVKPKCRSLDKDVSNLVLRAYLPDLCYGLFT